jgi:hypothetical protein
MSKNTTLIFNPDTDTPSGYYDRLRDLYPAPNQAAFLDAYRTVAPLSYGVFTYYDTVSRGLAPDPRASLLFESSSRTDHVVVTSEYATNIIRSVNIALAHLDELLLNTQARHNRALPGFSWQTIRDPRIIAFADALVARNESLDMRLMLTRGLGGFKQIRELISDRSNGEVPYESLLVPVIEASLASAPLLIPPEVPHNIATAVLSEYGLTGSVKQDN